MSTLLDVMAAPNPHYVNFTRSTGKPWLLEENFQQLGPLQYEGRPVSSTQLFNLSTQLLFGWSQCWNLVPVEWHADLYHVLALKANEDTMPSFDQAVRNLACLMAGPKSLDLIQSWLRLRVNDFYSVSSLAMALWKLEGLAGLPLIAESLRRRAVLSNYRDQALAELDVERTKLGISAPAWDLLFLQESALTPDKLKKTGREQARKLRDLMERNVRLNPIDLRLLIDHPAYSESVRGLVWALYSSTGELLRTFVLPDPLDLATGESLAIAHPAALPPEEIARWKAAFAAEGLQAPFDQWQGAADTVLQLEGLTVEPCALFLSLESKGWTRHRPDSSGVIRRHSKLFPDLNLRAEIEYTGVPTAYGSQWTPQTIQSCHFFREPSGIALVQTEVNPIAASAVMADLATLREKNT